MMEMKIRKLQHLDFTKLSFSNTSTIQPSKPPLSQKLFQVQKILCLEDISKHTGQANARRRELASHYLLIFCIAMSTFSLLFSGNKEMPAQTLVCLGGGVRCKKQRTPRALGTIPDPCSCSRSG